MKYSLVKNIISKVTIDDSSIFLGQSMFALVALFVLIGVRTFAKMRWYFAFPIFDSGPSTVGVPLYWPPSWVNDPINIMADRLHRCYWRMFETKCVGDSFGHLVTKIHYLFTRNSVTNIQKSSLRRYPRHCTLIMKHVWLWFWSAEYCPISRILVMYYGP